MQTASVFDFATPSTRRSWWPYLLAIVGAMAMVLAAAFGIASELASPSGVAPEHIDEALAAFEGARHLAENAAIAFGIGHAILAIALLCIAAHGHRTGVAVVGTLATAVGYYLLTYGRPIFPINVMVGLGPSVALVGIAVIREVGAITRGAALLAAAALIAVGILPSDILSAAWIAAGVAYLAFALSAWRLRVAPYRGRSVLLRCATWHRSLSLRRSSGARSRSSRAA